MQNKRLRAYAKERHVALWEIAKFVGLSETYYVKLLREEFGESRKKEFIQAVDEIVFARRQREDQVTRPEVK